MSDLLFMYLAPDGTGILKDCEIRMSNPCWLNDPFDFKPGSLSDIPEEELLASLKTPKSPLRCITERLDPILKAQNSQTFSELLVANPAEAVRITKQTWPLIEPGYMKLFHDDASNWWRLACFALRNDGILLWTHYADKNRGFVVAFDKATLLRELPDEAHLPVQYRSERPSIRHMLSPSIEQEAVVRQCVATKSLEWAYEE